MKKRIAMLLLVAILTATGITACCETVEVYPEQEIVQQLMDAVGTDLAERAKAAGFSLDINFSYYKFELPENRTLPEGQDTEDHLLIEIDLRSAIGTTLYGNNTVDCALMAELQHAILHSGVFALTDEEISYLSEYAYTPDSNFADVYVADDSINMHINETPGGYEAILFLRHWGKPDVSFYKLDWSSTYEWGELTYRH